MGNIVGKQFKVVASKNVTDSLNDSVKEGNQAKFYLAQKDYAKGKALDEVTSPDEFSDRNVIIINGNTIQGVSKNDIIKLDAISDATKLFKYKGSVSTGYDLLKKVPPEANVGDVWNVEQECEINGIKYPPYTNFVCSYIKISPASASWDSLGGIMISVSSAYPQRNDRQTLSFSSYGHPMDHFTLKVDKYAGLYINSNNEISLGLSTYRGINVDKDNFIYLLLSTEKEAPLDASQYVSCANSGLAFNKQGGLTVAIGNSGTNNGDFIDGALVLGSAIQGHGGLCISSSAMTRYIKSNTDVRIYIDSLIDAKLKAQ